MQCVLPQSSRGSDPGWACRPSVNVPEPVVNVAVPEQPAPHITVNVDDAPSNARVDFQRERQGRIKSAAIERGVRS
jgi:hypothetical protein